MGSLKKHRRFVVSGIVVTLLLSQCVSAVPPFPIIFPEQRYIDVRQPGELMPSPIPQTPPPETVSAPLENPPPRLLSLDEAIQIGLANSEVVRVLAGTTAVASGSTIYDPAVTNVTIDEQNARFDPMIQVGNSFNRIENPRFNQAPPQVIGERRDNYTLGLSANKVNILGGNFTFGVDASPTRLPSLGQESSPSSVELGYTQPLLRGSGQSANLAPIVLARLDTERSFFRYKDSVQRLVQGIIEAYWQLVLSRTLVWVREQQVAQLDESLQIAEARLEAGSGDISNVSQARTSLSNFRATLIGARADKLNREAALRNILGFPPYDEYEIIPITPPQVERMEISWHGILELAGEQRPDIIELKLILEADEQRLVQANNQALPALDAVALYRWNGIEGEVPAGRFASGPGQYTDWTLGVNFSVPLGLRSERANLRRQELLIARDRANLQQGMHNVAHVLAANLRNLATFYEQYEEFRITREASRQNLEAQYARYESGLQRYVEFLLAVTDWGNAVSNSAQSLLQYNIALATLENETGTILESHGVAFYEERFGSISPLGRFHPDHWYPESMPSTPNDLRYTTEEQSTDPAEQSFGLESPLEWRGEDGRARTRTRNPQEELTPPPPIPGPAPSFNP